MSSSHTHSDIFLKGYVGRLPKSLRAYALLIRLDRPVGTWLLFQPCAFGVFLASAPIPMPQRFAWLSLFLIGAWAMRSAGCIINDLWDRKIDALVERTKNRPLASGDISPRQAIAFLGLLLLVAFFLLLLLPPFCWKLGIAGLILTALYPSAKRFTACPQLVLGFTFGLGALVAYGAVMKHLSLSAISLYLGVVLWQMGYDTIYGFQDMADDIKIGVKSASLLVRNHAKLFIAFCYGGASALFVLSGILENISWIGILTLLPGILLLLRQIILLNPLSPEKCLAQFKQNVFIGWIFTAGWIAARLLS